jgi:hypothetical protein
MTTNPWDVRRAETAEKDPDALYLSIGRALSAWERMEQRFAGLFSFFCGGSMDVLTAIRAYGSVITFRGRADMLRSAAEAYFHPTPVHKFKDTFTELLNRACNLSPRRNEIAHGCVEVAFYESLPPESLGPTQRLNHFLSAQRWLLFPAEYATNKHELTPPEAGKVAMVRRKYGYSSVEIDHYRQQFDGLRQDVWKMIMDWAKEYPEADILPPI